MPNLEIVKMYKRSLKRNLCWSLIEWFASIQWNAWQLLILKYTMKVNVNILLNPKYFLWQPNLPEISFHNFFYGWMGERTWIFLWSLIQLWTLSARQPVETHTQFALNCLNLSLNNVSLCARLPELINNYDLWAVFWYFEWNFCLGNFYGDSLKHLVCEFLTKIFQEFARH